MTRHANLPTSLPRALYWVGRQAGRRSPARILRRFALCLGSFMTALTVIATLLGGARVDGTLERGYRDDAIPAVTASSRHLYVQTSLGMVGTAPVTVVAVSEIDGKVTAPGVERLPRAGEAVLSPQLRQDLGAGTERYGRVIGTIDPEELETPTERRVYVGLKRTPAGAVAASGFGPEAGTFQVGSAILYQPAKWSIMLAIGLTLGCAGVAALAIGVGIRAGSRRSVERLLELSGATTRARLLVTMGSDLPSLAVGVIGAVCITAPLLWHDVSVPGTATTLSAEDARRVAWAWPAAVVTALSVGLVLSRAAGRAPRRPRARRTALSQSTGALVALGSLVLLRPLLGLLPAGLRLPGFILGVLLAAVLLPRLVAGITVGIGALAAQVARRAGMPGTLVAGRQMHAHPDRTMSMATPVTVGVLVLALVTLWGGVLGRQDAQARQTMALAQGRLAEVTLQGAAPPAFHAFLSSPGPGISTVLVTPSATGDVDTLTTDCAGLTSLGLSCRSGRQQLSTIQLARALDGWVTPMVNVRPGSLPRAIDENSLLYLVSASRPIDIGPVTRAAVELAPGAATVGLAGQRWTVASSTAATQAAWLMLLGVLALAVTVLSFAAATIASLSEHVAESASVLRWSDRRAPLAAMAWWRGTLPYLLAFSGALLAAEWFALIVHEQDVRFALPAAFCPVLTWVSLALTGVIGVAAYWMLRRAD